MNCDFGSFFHKIWSPVEIDIYISYQYICIYEVQPAYLPTRLYFSLQSCFFTEYMMEVTEATIDQGPIL
jgi:hypothetical protein